MFFWIPRSGNPSLASAVIPAKASVVKKREYAVDSEEICAVSVVPRSMLNMRGATFIWLQRNNFYGTFKN